MMRQREDPMPWAYRPRIEQLISYFRPVGTAKWKLTTGGFRSSKS